MLPVALHPRAWLLLLALAAAAGVSRGDTWTDPCDTPEVAWRLALADPVTRVVRHERTAIGGSNGAPRLAERIEYECPPASAAWFWRDVPAAAVIDELRVAVSMRSDRPGTQAAAEVVLPRTIDPITGRPQRLVIRSISADVTPAGDALLRLDNFPTAVQRHARGARLASVGGPTAGRDAPPPTIDPRGAYLTRVGLVAPGGERPTELWITEVRVEGLVPPPPRTDSPIAESDPVDAGTRGPGVEEQPAAKIGGRVEASRVTLSSEGFRVDAAPYFPRAWSWRGEGLEALARGGFNTLWLEDPPTPDLLREAASRKMRLLCPPPADVTLPDGVSWSPVLAWVLAGERDERSLDMGLADVNRLRSLRAEQQRPVLALVLGDAASWSRAVDGIVVSTASSRFAA
ncbi:MAG: hypothetical protein ACRCT8_14275, partial [Lacipirellulaceae bacterium]